MSALAGIPTLRHLQQKSRHIPNNVEHRGLTYNIRKSLVGRVCNAIGALFQDNLLYDLSLIPERNFQACTAIIKLSKQEQLDFTSVNVIHETIKTMFPSINLVMITDFFKESFTSSECLDPSKETLTIIPMIADNHFTLLAKTKNMILYFNSKSGTTLENQRLVRLDRNTSQHEFAMPEIKTVGDVFNHYTKGLDIRITDVPNQAPSHDLIQEDFTSCGVYGMTFVYKLCCTITNTFPRDDQGEGLQSLSTLGEQTSPRAPRRFWIRAITQLKSGQSGDTQNQESKTS